MAGRLKGSWKGLSTWLGGSKKKSDERRMESRLPGHGVVEVRWADPSGEIRTIDTHLINVSAGGFEVRAREKIDVGSEIEICDPMGRTGRGVVLHSRADFDEYLVGGSADWSETKPAPDHKVNGAGSLSGSSRS